MFRTSSSILHICSFLALLVPIFASSIDATTLQPSESRHLLSETLFQEQLVRRQDAAAKECKGAVLNTTISPETNSMLLRWNLQSLQKGLYAGAPQDFLQCSLSLSLGQSWQFAATGVNWVGRAKLPEAGMLLKTSISFSMQNVSPRQYSWTLSAPSENNFMLKGDIPPPNQIWTSCSDTSPMEMDWYTKLITIDPAVSGGILWIPPPTNEPFHLEVQFDLRPCGQPDQGYSQSPGQNYLQSPSQNYPQQPSQSYAQQPSYPTQQIPARPSYPQQQTSTRPRYPSQQTSARPRYPQQTSPRQSASAPQQGSPRQPYQQQSNAYTLPGQPYQQQSTNAYKPPAYTNQQGNAYQGQSNASPRQGNNPYPQQPNTLSARTSDLPYGVNLFTPTFSTPRQSYSAGQQGDGLVNTFVPTFGFPPPTVDSPPTTTATGDDDDSSDSRRLKQSI